jgi:hypothetical protein
MEKFFTPNIDGKGRLVRGLMGVVLIVSAAYIFSVSFWLALLLAVAGVFGLFEALHGWCAARACGIKTRL